MGKARGSVGHHRLTWTYFVSIFQNKKKKTERQKHKQRQGQINDQARKMQRQNEKWRTRISCFSYMNSIYGHRQRSSLSQLFSHDTNCHHDFRANVKNCFIAILTLSLHRLQNFPKNEITSEIWSITEKFPISLTFNVQVYVKETKDAPENFVFH